MHETKRKIAAPAAPPAPSGTVDAAEIAKFSAIAEEWWDEKGKFKPLHQLNPARIQYLRDRISGHFGAKEAFSPLSGLSLLDIGCGGGLISEPMTRLGAEVTGIDAAPRNIEVARLHARQMGLATQYRATTAEALAESGATFDVVLALEIIEHVADVNLFLRTIGELVKPGGMLILSTLNRTMKSLLMAKIGAEYILRWLPVGTHDWSKFLQPAELILPLQQNGFEMVDMSGLVYSPLRQQWRVDPKDTDVNYLLCFVRSKN